MAARTNNRNGLIELFRFLCSVWVAYFHGFFPILSDKFNSIIVPVDFFFIVTGYFFLQSIKKYASKSIWFGTSRVFWDRIKKFVVPLIIAAFSILLCNIFVPLDFGGFNWPFSFLWFFAAQFIFLTLYYLLFRCVKRRLIFNIICGIIILVSLSLFRLEIKSLDIFFRGPAMIALGILTSQIPKIDFKKSATAKKLSLLINSVGFTIAAAAFILLVYFPGFAVWKIHTICYIVFPAFMYFVTTLPVRSSFLNMLGDLSIFIYLAQCPILLHHYFVSDSRDTREQFPWLCVCTVLLIIVNLIVNHRNKKVKRATAE